MASPVRSKRSREIELFELVSQNPQESALKDQCVGVIGNFAELSLDNLEQIVKQNQGSFSSNLNDKNITMVVKGIRFYSKPPEPGREQEDVNQVENNEESLIPKNVKVLTEEEFLTFLATKADDSQNIIVLSPRNEPVESFATVEIQGEES